MTQKYYGTKLIEAWPQQKNTQATSDTPASFQEGYAVKYTDGYISWSPKDVFEAAYQPLNAMSFGHAIEALKAGSKVARSGWNGKGMWLLFVPESHWGINSNIFDYEENGKDLHPWIGMKTADDKFVPWLASQTDMLANDWQVIE